MGGPRAVAESLSGFSMTFLLSYISTMLLSLLKSRDQSCVKKFRLFPERRDQS
jgi:hypothetical protein